MDRRVIGVLSLLALVLSFACLPAYAGNPLNLLPTPKVLRRVREFLPSEALARNSRTRNPISG